VRSVGLLLLAGCAAGAPPAKPACYLFLMTDCPIANKFAPEIGRIVAAYPQVEFTVVYVDADKSDDEIARHAREFGHARFVIDRERALVRKFGATVTPEAVAIDGGRVVYLGRIDDRYYDLGKWRFEPTTRDLRAALDAVVAGRPVEVARTKAVGCTIP
jgi:hypothetical protein